MVAANVIAATLNIVYDRPHEPESRPNYAEVCYTSWESPYPYELVTVAGEPRIIRVNHSGVPSGSEDVFDVGPYNRPDTRIQPAAWVEIARPQSYVCDGSGRVTATFRIGE